MPRRITDLFWFHPTFTNSLANNEESLTTAHIII